MSGSEQSGEWLTKNVEIKQSVSQSRTYLSVTTDSFRFILPVLMSGFVFILKGSPT